jgi:hypothetical protein
LAEQNIQVSAPATQYFESAVRTCAEQMRRVSDNQLQLRNVWQDRSSDAFAMAMDEWESQFTTVIEELAHMVEVMGGNVTACTRHEESAVRTAARWAREL